MAIGESLNGWQRVGVVLSALVGIPAAIIGYDATDSLFAFYYADGEVMAMTGQAQTNAVWAAYSAKEPEKAAACIHRTIRITAPSAEYDHSFMIVCDNMPIYAIGGALKAAAGAVGFIWLVGWTIAWVRRGFRKQKAQAST